MPKIVQRGALCFLKLQFHAKPFGVFLKENGNLEQSHSVEKCEMGTLWDFLDINSVAKYQKLKREILWRH